MLCSFNVARKKLQPATLKSKKIDASKESHFYVLFWVAGFEGAAVMLDLIGQLV